MQELDLTYDTWRRSPSTSNAKRVLDVMKPDMERAIRVAGGQPSPLTLGMAKRVVLDAMRSYAPQKDASFRTHASNQLRQLTRPIRGTKFTTKIPDMRARVAASVRSVSADLEAEHGREPSDMELADRLGIPLKHVQQARGGVTPEVVTADVEAPEEIKESDLIKDMVYYSLPERDQVLMEYLFGFNGVKPKSTNEVARLLRVTPGAVSQRASKIRQLLQEAEGLSGG